MVWSHNDLWMLTADHAGFIKYWQSNMNNVKMYQAHKDPVRGLRWEPIRRVLVASHFVAMATCFTIIIMFLIRVRFMLLVWLRLWGYYHFFSLFVKLDFGEYLYQ